MKRPATPQRGEIGEGELFNSPVPWMRFTLVYDGPLPAQSSGDCRVGHKHRLREVFHSQLAELWAERESLRRALGRYRAGPPPVPERPPLSDKGKKFYDLADRAREIEDWRHRGILVPFERGAFTFIPLATKKFDLVCELDIVFLRAEEPGSLFTNTAGDLDNRLKVLFDALRVPGPPELPTKAAPTERQRPFFCLMEDDKLITSLRVETERLLDEDQKSNRVMLMIRVTLKARRMNDVTRDLESD